MKKSLVLGAVLAAIAGGASAQSVTLFGVVDANVRFAKTGSQSLTTVSQDGLNASRLGVRGTEDLGGGLKAGFWLEAALNPDTGASDASRFWGRRATVSLSSADLGEIRVGRHKAAARLVADGFSPWETTGAADLTAGYSKLGTAVDVLNRSDNQVAYSLPDNLGGFYGTAEAATGEAVDGKKYFGGRFGYKTKELNVAAGFTNVDAKGSKYKLAIVGAQYDFGVATAAATYTTTKFGTAEQKIITLTTTVPVSNEGRIRAFYVDGKSNDAAKTSTVKTYDYTQFAVGYVHDVSKRTALYTTYSQLSNGTGGTLALVGSPAAKAGDKSSALEVGLRHSF